MDQEPKSQNASSPESQRSAPESLFKNEKLHFHCQFAWGNCLHLSLITALLSSYFRKFWGADPSHLVAGASSAPTAERRHWGVRMCFLLIHTRQDVPVSSARFCKELCALCGPSAGGGVWEQPSGLLPCTGGQAWISCHPARLQVCVSTYHCASECGKLKSGYLLKIHGFGNLVCSARSH